MLVAITPYTRLKKSFCFEIISCFQSLFQLGIQHSKEKILTIILTPKQIRKETYSHFNSLSLMKAYLTCTPSEKMKEEFLNCGKDLFSQVLAQVQSTDYPTRVLSLEILTLLCKNYNELTKYPLFLFSFSHYFSSFHFPSFSPIFLHFPIV